MKDDGIRRREDRLSDKVLRESFERERRLETPLYQQVHQEISRVTNGQSIDIPPETYARRRRHYKGRGH